MILKDRTARLQAYATIGVGGALLAATSAEANIIFTDFMGSATLGNDLSLDIDGDGQVDFTMIVSTVGPNMYGTNSWRADLSPTTAFAGFMGTDAAPYLPVATGPSNLPYGASIGGTFYAGRGPLQMAYTGFGTGSYGGFTTATPSGFIGIEFFDGVAVRMGWIGVNMTGGVAAGLGGVAINVNGFAYAIDRPITAGQIPAPGALSLLALGAAGVGSRRRKK